MSLTRYRCGHVGRENTGGKTRAFIRVAEARDEKVEDADKTCPDCKGGS